MASYSVSSDGSEEETNGFFVDKKLLAKAVQLKLLKKEKKLCFSFGKQILTKDFTLRALKLDEFGDISIPVSIQDIERLKAIFEQAPCGKGSKHFNYYPSKSQQFKIDSLSQLSTALEKLNLSSLIVQHLGLPAASMNVQAKLDKLILYETEGYYKHDFNFGKEPGTFGTATLQLPVEGGHEGGRATITFRGVTKMLDSHQNNDKSFYLSAFYGNCDYSIEPITRGWKLSLVFNLVSKNSKIPVDSKDFPYFIGAWKDIEEALAHWIPHQTINLPIETGQDCTVSITETESKTVSESGKAHKPATKKCRISYESDGENEFDYLEMDFDDLLVGDKPCENDVLYFVLNENYHVKNFKFDCLRGADLELANILLNCCFLEVHLAVVKFKSENHDYEQPGYKTHTVEITRWIDSNDVSRKLSLGVSWRDQLVGPLREFLTFDLKRAQIVEKLGRDKSDNGDSDYEDDSFEEDSEDDSFEEDSEDDSFEEDSDEDNWVYSTQNNFILVIWPKHQSFQMYCRYDLHSLLGSVENLLSLASAKKGSQEAEENRKTAVEDFKKIMSVCCEEPEKIWGDWVEKAKQKGELTSRLLRLCIALRAREEGLEILKILGRDFKRKCKFRKYEYFEGIKSEKVAKAISDFISQVTGLEDCMGLIKKMTSPHRVIKQLAPICQLAQCFLDVNCVEGANMVGNQISTSLANIEAEQAAELKRVGVESFLNLILSLETNPQTSNRERTMSFVSLFPKLNHLLQCRLLLDLEGQLASRFKDIESCRFLFDQLCKALLQCEIFKNQSYNTYYGEKTVIGFIKDMVVDLLKLYVLRGNAEWLQIFISNICREPETSKTCLLSIILSSPVIWELGASSECYRLTCKFFLDQDFVSLVNNAEGVKFKIVHCLLRLNDGQFWATFATKICASFSSEKSYEFVRVFLRNVDVQQAIVKSSAGFSPCILILDYWLEHSKSHKKPVFNWCQSEATLSSYPEIERFLRSPKKRMIYRKIFMVMADCRVLAAELKSKGPLNGFSVEVKSIRKGFEVRCKITKTRDAFEQSKKNFVARKSELPQLDQLRRSLVKGRSSGN